MSTSKLFQPIQIGSLSLKHRVILAPLTRYRADSSHVHHENAVEYYRQRASTAGTLLITEATFIAEDAGGFKNVPGIYTDAQIEAWRKVTEAVHKEGSYIFLQLWALGRAADSRVLAKEGHKLVGASDVALDNGKKGVPEGLTKDEIKGYVEKYTIAAKNAVERAGFDGVEVHGANGYLVDQFIQTNSNTRTDEYGGSIENRTRFAREVMKSVTDAIGESRTSIRLSPWSHFQEMRMDDPVPTFSFLLHHLASQHTNLAYVSLVAPHIAGDSDAEEVQHSSGSHPADSNDFARKIWAPRPLIYGGGYTGEPKHAMKDADEQGVLVAFGRAFLANPDLPLRLKHGMPLNDYNRKTFYTRGEDKAEGYTDYPFAHQLKANL